MLTQELESHWSDFHAIACNVRMILIGVWENLQLHVEVLK